METNLSLQKINACSNCGYEHEILNNEIEIFFDNDKKELLICLFCKNCPLRMMIKQKSNENKVSLREIFLKAEKIISLWDSGILPINKS